MHMNKLKEKIQQLSHTNHAHIVDIRRHIHANPELSFQEYKTAEFIATTLKGYGLSVQEHIAHTGLMVQIEGQNPTKRIIALRGDIDALPIQEANNIS